MIKFGFYRPEQLSFKALNGTLGKRRFIALDLYDRMDDLSPDLRSEVQERILSRFPTANGVFKYTFSRRFEEFDNLAAKEILENFLPQQTQKIKIHDAGVSDGRTSLPLFERLEKFYGKKLDFLASDYALCVYVVSNKEKSRIRLVFDKDGNLLQIIAPPFVFNITHKESRWLYPLNHLIRIFVMKFFASRLLEHYRTKKADGFFVKKVAILAPECLNLMTSDSRFHVHEKNIFDLPEEKYQVVRVMNLLNKSYFGDDDLRRALVNLIGSLCEGGLLITGSNKERGTIVDGSIYRKQDTHMECLYHSGKGSPVHDMIVKQQ